MSLGRDQWVTVAAVVVLVVAVPVLWQIASVRTMQAAEQEADLVDQVVQTRQSATDYDGDGIPDATDRCPTRAETENGYQDDDGCPDVVETTGAS